MAPDLVLLAPNLEQHLNKGSIAGMFHDDSLPLRPIYVHEFRPTGGPLSCSRSMIALLVYAATAILTPCVGSICSGPSFRASASHSTHVKPTYTLAVKPSSCESNKRPCVPSPFRCPRNSDVMKKRDSRNLKVTFLVSLEGIQLPRDPNVC